MAAPAERIPAAEIDRGRLERIFNSHHASVWRALRRRGLSAEAAEDATQETFLLAAEKLEDIRADSERAFLIATAVRVAHTLGRKTVRWELNEDMDERLADSRDTSEKRADIQLCDLVLAKVALALCALHDQARGIHAVADVSQQGLDPRGAED